MQYDFDIIFLDTTANKYYDRQVLETQPLGGTEATVVRVAEGLAAFGLKVCVIQSQTEYFEPTMGQHCFFMHAKDIESTSCRHFVQIRRNWNPTLYPDAKKYLWLHDVATSDPGLAESLKENNIKILAVSRWHRNQIRDVVDYEYSDYVYNPVPDEIFVSGDARPKYDANLLVWMSSPHKGLGKALELFKQVRERSPKMQMIVFNPGYFKLDPELALTPGLAIYGPMACKQMWVIVQKALCVFYPTQWDETFGLVAAEANALGTPIATFKRAALKEVVSSDQQFAENDDVLVEKVLNWSKNGRPITVGKDEFRFSNVILDWVGLLASK